MVIDSSAIIAVALDEPARDFEKRIVDDPVRLVSAATVLEAAIVIEARYGDAGGIELGRWLSSIGAEIVPGGPCPRRGCTSRLADVRQGSASCRAELRRLLLLCLGKVEDRDIAFQG